MSRSESGAGHGVSGPGLQPQEEKGRGAPSGKNVFFWSASGRTALIGSRLKPEQHTETREVLAAKIDSGWCKHWRAVKILGGYWGTGWLHLHQLMRRAIILTHAKLTSTLAIALITALLPKHSVHLLQPFTPLENIRPHRRSVVIQAQLECTKLHPSLD